MIGINRCIFRVVLVNPGFDAFLNDSPKLPKGFQDLRIKLSVIFVKGC
jgi:hypothetical protein